MVIRLDRFLLGAKYTHTFRENAGQQISVYSPSDAYHEELHDV